MVLQVGSSSADSGLVLLYVEEDFNVSSKSVGLAEQPSQAQEAERTKSNSSSLSSYSRFSSSSSNPGAYALQFSTIGVTHV